MDSLDDTNRSAGSESDFVSDWERWHRDHEERRARPHGFLAVTAIHWLTDLPERFSDVPGSWYANAGGVTVLLEEDEELTIDGDTARGRFQFGDVDERGRTAYFNDSLVEVARRDAHYMIRPRDPQHEVRTRYTGTPTYPVSTDWLVEGRFVPNEAPTPVTVQASIEGLSHVYMSPGEIALRLAGRELRLVAFNGDEAGELFIVFSDLTSGNTSYAACRFLDVDAPDADDRVTLDFNRATNPPCAYTQFATCPLPPSGNDLPVRVEAGEMVPRETY